MANVGDIVFVKFTSEANTKIRPALVLDVEEGRLVVAYGSSKKVDKSSPPKGEVVISDNEDILDCGLVCPTRFDLGIRMKVSDTVKVVGSLPKHKYAQLYKAAVYHNLLNAE